MFGLVTQKSFDEERAARIAAEKAWREAESRAAAAEAGEKLWQQLAGERNADVRVLIEHLKDQRASQSKEFADLLDHLKPPIQTITPEEGEHKFAGLTYEEIMATPVATRTEMINRRKAAERARERQMSEKDRTARDERFAKIRTAEELRANSLDFDAELGVFLDKKKATEAADATN